MSEANATPIAETPLVVVDTETTGTSADRGRIIEIAAVRLVDGKVIDRFSSLVNPRRTIPHKITRITGISTAMLVGEPEMDEVMPRFLDFLGDDIFVAHNRGFDEGFINAELKRLGRDALQNEMLCTLRLARRLLPGLKSKSLASLVDYYGVELNSHHRALADAEATAQVLLRLLSKLEFEHEIDTVDELLTFQYRTYRRSRTSSEPDHLRHIRQRVLPHLPDRPGVYFMKNQRGSILYIGKALSLKDRVRSYFTAIASHPPRIKKLVDKVRTVEWTETGSELEALLEESKLIKKHKPRFNRAQRRYRSRPFIRLDTTDTYPTLTWTTALRDDGAEYFGPLTSKKTADQIVDLIGRFFDLRECEQDRFQKGKRCFYAQIERCGAPCEGGEGATEYPSEVERVRAFLRGEEDDILTRLQERMQAASERLDFEQAAVFRDGMERIEHLLGRQQCVAASVLSHDAVVIEDAPDDARNLFFVRYGRLAERLTVTVPLTEDDRDCIADCVESVFCAPTDRPERYHREEVDEIRILLHWMYTARDHTRQIPWSDDLTPDAFTDRLERAIANDTPSVDGSSK